MIIVGVTGLPCSGKSLAAAMLTSGKITGVRGGLIKADDLGHAVLERPEVVRKLTERFGDGILADGGGGAMRRRIAERVFSNPGELAWLEGLVHPLVAEETERILTGLQEGMAVIEAALLFAAGMERLCERVLVLEADLPIRLRRAAGRGWSREELERRDRRQSVLFAPDRLAAMGGKIAIVPNNSDENDLVDELRRAMRKEM